MFSCYSFQYFLFEILCCIEELADVTTVFMYLVTIPCNAVCFCFRFIAGEVLSLGAMVAWIADIALLYCPC